MAEHTIIVKVRVKDGGKPSDPQPNGPFLCYAIADVLSEHLDTERLAIESIHVSTLNGVTAVSL